MKRKSKGGRGDDLRPEYDLRSLLRNGVQGEYAERCRLGMNIVRLDPAVAKAFPTEASVNEALRLVIRLTRVPKPGRKANAALSG